MARRTAESNISLQRTSTDIATPKSDQILTSKNSIEIETPHFVNVYTNTEVEPYTKNGLHYLSELEYVHKRNSAGQLILDNNLDENQKLIIEPVKFVYTNESFIKAVNTTFNYFKFPDKVIVTENATNNIQDIDIDSIVAELESYTDSVNDALNKLNDEADGNKSSDESVPSGDFTILKINDTIETLYGAAIEKIPLFDNDTRNKVGFDILNNKNTLIETNNNSFNRVNISFSLKGQFAKAVNTDGIPYVVRALFVDGNSDSDLTGKDLYNKANNADKNKNFYRVQATEAEQGFQIEAPKRKKSDFYIIVEIGTGSDAKDFTGEKRIKRGQVNVVGGELVRQDNGETRVVVERSGIFNGVKQDKIELKFG